MRISWTIVVLGALIAGTGCQEKAGIRIADKTVDSVAAPGPSSVEGPAVSVVTGESVVTSDDKKEGGTTGEDKTGAVALKLQY